MEESVFRNKSVERISSPEALDKYLKVTTPSVWLILIGIIVVLAGIIVWGNVGHLETKVPAACIVEKSHLTCLFDENDADAISEGMKMRIADNEYEIADVSSEVFLLDAYGNDLLKHILGDKDNVFVYAAKGMADLKDGTYKGEIITETISPIKFVLN